MAVPTGPTYTASILSAGNTQFLTDVDSGSSNGVLRLRDENDTLLSEIALTDPAGTVDGVTGVLTFTAASATTPTVDGDAAYGEVCDSDDNVHFAAPCIESTSAIVGYFALNSLTIVAGEPISITTFTVG